MNKIDLEISFVSLKCGVAKSKSRTLFSDVFICRVIEKSSDVLLLVVQTDSSYQSVVGVFNESKKYWANPFTNQNTFRPEFIY